jgi:tetratricopeptide (TPR) repeat protein
VLRGELDWVVMKALEKDRDRRYESASAFAADVERYLNDEPVQACPPSVGYRLRKFVRRNKRLLATLALLSVMLLALVGVVAGSLGWRLHDRAARRAKLNTAVEAAVQEGSALQGRALTLTGQPAQWAAAQAEAFAALRRAEALAAGDEELLDRTLKARVQELAARLQADEKDRLLVAAVERIRLERSQVDVKHSQFSDNEAAPKYRSTFAAHGLVAVATPPGQAAALIRGKHPGLQAALVAALDDWLGRAQRNIPEIEWLWAVLTTADGDRWRNKVRAALRQGARQRLLALADHKEALRQPPGLLSNLGSSLYVAGEHPTAIRLLRRAQERYPADFWINHQLAWALQFSKPPQLEEAVAHYRVALALRPENAGVCVNLGRALQARGDLPGAIAIFERAVAFAPDYAVAHINLGSALYHHKDLSRAIGAFRKGLALDPHHAEGHFRLAIALEDRKDLDGAMAEYRKTVASYPKHVGAHSNLGNVLLHRGDLDGAIAEYRTALEIDRNDVKARTNLGVALKGKGDLDGALAEYREVLKINPKHASAHCNLGIVLAARKDRAGAIAAFRKAIALDPTLAEAHLNFGGALMGRGDLDGAIAAYGQAIRHKPNYTEAHFNLGIARAHKGEMDGAAAAFRQAIRLRPNLAKAHYALGTALAGKREMAGAIAAFREAIRHQPDYAEAHTNLGLALKRSGQFAEALAAFRALQKRRLRGPKEGPFSAAREVRDCERLLALHARLPAVLRGEDAPADAAECLKFAYLCLYKQLPGAAARFFTDAFRAAPKLAADLRAGDRFGAARAAALAGTGQGKDADQLDAAARARWRRQALDWLRADLQAWGRLLDSEPGEAPLAANILRKHWLADPDLAGVRGPDAFARLPAAERQPWRELWDDVAATLARARGMAAAGKRSDAK